LALSDDALFVAAVNEVEVVTVVEAMGVI